MKEQNYWDEQNKAGWGKKNKTGKTEGQEEQNNVIRCSSDHSPLNNKACKVQASETWVITVKTNIGLNKWKWINVSKHK